MLHDDKNIDYQDQIYYALGNLAIKEGNEEKALEYYTKSVEANKGNEQQKIRSYLTLANHLLLPYPIIPMHRLIMTVPYQTLILIIQDIMPCLQNRKVLPGWLLK